MSNTVVLKRNYVDADVYAGLSYSSQLAIAPASNVSAQVRRTQVWRGAGFWEITSGNNALVFRETTGVNLTATIAVGSYATDAAFLSAVKSALDAAGDSTYTVTRDASKKIRIVSNGAGGGGVFQIMGTNAGSTAAAILGFSTTADRTGALNYLSDLIRIHTSEWIRIDMGIPSRPDICAILGKSGTPIRISSSAIVKLQASHTDAWTSPAWEQVLPYAELGIAVYEKDGLGGGTAYRYWRLVIIDPSNPLGSIEISKVMIGEALAPARGAVQFPLNGRDMDLSSTGYTESGLAVTEKRGRASMHSLEWAFLTTAEFEEMREFVTQVGTGTPFLLVLDANQVFSSSSTQMTRLVRFTDDPGYRLVGPNRFSYSWSVREEV